MRLPVPARRSMMISAMMLTAISSGDSAFSSRPMGDVTRDRSSSVTPMLRSFSTQISQQMGLTPVAHVEGGFNAWKQAGGPVARKEKR